MRRVLIAALLCVLGALPAFAQKAPINGVAGPTSSTQLRSIIKDPTGTGSLLFQGGNIGAGTATSLGLNGATSGVATLTAPSVAGTPTITMPTISTTLPTITGTLTNGNVACQTATGIVDCGVAPITTAPANTVWGNSTGSSAAPSFIAQGLLPSKTFATLPSASTANLQYRCTDCGAGGSTWVSNGTRWKPLNYSTKLKTLDAPSAAIGNTQTIVLQYQMPANFWQVGDVVRVYGSLSKPGATDTGIYFLNVGTNCTNSDASVLSSTLLSAANHQNASIFDILLADSTHIQLLNNGNGYSGVSTGNALGSLIVVAPGSQLCIDVGIKSGGATDTVVLLQGAIEYHASTN